MEAGESPLIVRLVERLFPPACREDVIGDLYERAESGGAFLADALLALPFVVWSRIRRTSEPWVLIAECWALLITFRFAAGTGASWAALSVPAAAAILGIMLRDAYAPDGPRSRPALAADAALGAAAASVAASAEVMLAAHGSSFALPATAARAGCALAFAVLAALRVTLHGGDRPRAATTAGGRVDLASLRRQSDRWWNIFWLAGVLYVVTMALVLSARLPPRYTWTATMAALLASQVMRSVGKPRRAGEQTSINLPGQLATLQRRRDHMQFWPKAAASGLAVVCAFPLVGYLLIRVTDALLRIDTPASFDPAQAWPVWGPVAGISLVWFLVGSAVSRRAARALQSEIDALQSPRHDD
jgi:hypothetical protein